MTVGRGVYHGRSAAARGVRVRAAQRSLSVDEVVVVFTNLPARQAALKLAEELIARRLAACVNILAPCTSFYRWKGRAENASEVPVLIKTTKGRYPGVEAAIRALHPYELPEVLAVPAVRGLEPYMKWVTEEVTDRRGTSTK